MPGRRKKRKRINATCRHTLHNAANGRAEKRLGHGVPAGEGVNYEKENWYRGNIYVNWVIEYTNCINNAIINL